MKQSQPPKTERRKKNTQEQQRRFANKSEKVHHPAHYNAGQFEVIDVIEDWKLGFNDGNAVKYIARFRHKTDPLADLKKARWYLDRLISEMEKPNCMSSPISLSAETQEHSTDFLQGMLYRMDLSFAKYGLARKNYTGQYSKEFIKDLTGTLSRFIARWENRTAQSTTAGGNAVLFMFKRLLAYARGFKGAAAGNTEYLIDSANGMMIEFMFPQVPGARFEPTDNTGSTGFAGLSTKEAESYRQ